MMSGSFKSVGFGIAMSYDQRMFVIGHYGPIDPLQNYEKNIKPPKGYVKPEIQKTYIL